MIKFTNEDLKVIKKHSKLLNTGDTFIDIPAVIAEFTEMYNYGVAMRKLEVFIQEAVKDDADSVEFVFSKV